MFHSAYVEARDFPQNTFVLDYIQLKVLGGRLLILFKLFAYCCFKYLLQRTNKIDQMQFKNRHSYERITFFYTYCFNWSLIDIPGHLVFALILSIIKDDGVIVSWCFGDNCSGTKARFEIMQHTHILLDIRAHCMQVVYKWKKE